MIDWNSLWETLQAAGLPGVLVGVVVLVFVYIGTATDIFKNGTIRRIAVLVSGLLFAGVEPGNITSAVEAAIGIAFATLAKLLIDAITAGVKVELAKRKK